VSPKSLTGTSVVILRVGDGPDAVADGLVEKGALASTVRVATVSDRADHDVAAEVGALDRFAWVAVTSANAARRLALWSARWPSGTRIGAVGPATLAAIGALGLRGDAVASEGTAADLARHIDAGPVLFLAAANARADLVHELASRGIVVATVVAYDVEPVALDPDARALVLASDAIVAMAPSAIDALVAMDERARRTARGIPLVAFGPSTERHAGRLGWPIASVALRRDPQAVADALGIALAR
jgi:uroporphyrinogen-III synthase